MQVCLCVDLVCFNQDAGLFWGRNGYFPVNGFLFRIAYLKAGIGAHNIN
jgi:hypothetical protein